MDITKWKSVAIKISDYKLLEGFCNYKYRAPNAMIGKLLHDYCEFQAKKLNVSLSQFKKNLLNGKYKKN